MFQRIGRIYKDLWDETRESDPATASGHLDDAIAALQAERLETTAPLRGLGAKLGVGPRSSRSRQRRARAVSAAR